MLEERYYSSPLVTVEEVDRRGNVSVIEMPAITREPGINPSFTSGEVGGDMYVKVAAEPEWWADFDTQYPNQDADSGAPYRRRFPRKNLPDVDFSE